ncbi:MAG: transporter substrate-binding domain-containing protein [Actinomycetota bacterium]
MRKSLYMLGVVAMLLLSACAEDEPTVTPKASPTIPSVTVNDCVNNAGSQAPAAPKGVDYKTQLNDAGVLSVGSDNAFPPFENIEAGKTEPTGFAVDLYKEIAKRLGLTAKSTTTSFDGLFTQSIPRGQFDVGISSITIKESRKQTVDFTDPYFEANLSLAVNVQKTPNIKTIDDLAGQTLGVQTGTTGADCADALVKQGKAKDVKKFDNAIQAFDDLVAGGVGAVVNDRPASEGIIAQRSAIKVVQVFETNEKYGIAISKDKPDLRVAINGALEAMMKDGTYATIYKTWFGTDVPFTIPIQ